MRWISEIKWTVLFAAVSALALPNGAFAAEKTIGFAMPNLASSFWISATYEVEQEAKARGYKVIKLNAGGDANATQQIAQIQDLMQRKVGAIIVGATNGDAVKAVVERAISSGIPVVGFSSPPNSKKLAAYITADHYDMGKLQAECLGKSLEGKGTVAMMAGPSGQAWADLRADGFRETLAKVYPNIKIIAESRLADNRNAALKTAEDWSQRFPDVSGIYSASDDMAAGIITALRSAGKSKVKVSTSNFSPTARALLTKGQLVCTSIQQIVAQGRAAAKQAINAAEKKPVKAKVVLPALLVTASNMKTVDMSGVSAPTTYRP